MIHYILRFIWSHGVFYLLTLSHMAPTVNPEYLTHTWSRDWFLTPMAIK